MSPYNRSLATCRRMERYLGELYDARTTVDFYADDPKELAYKLREAMYACQFHQDYQHIGRLKESFKFIVLDKKVRARWLEVEEPEMKVIVEHEKVTVLQDDPEADAFGKHLRDALSTVEVPQATSFMEVLGATMKYISANPEVYFPRAELNESELKRLYSWAKTNGVKIISHGEAGVTLTKKEIDEELAWQPEDV